LQEADHLMKKECNRNKVKFCKQVMLFETSNLKLETSAVFNMGVHMQGPRECFSHAKKRIKSSN